MGRTDEDVWAVVGGGLGQGDVAASVERRPRPEAPRFSFGHEGERSPLIEGVRWASRPVRQDTEIDAEAFPLARSLRWLRGESALPTDDERALDDAFVLARREEERARRRRVVRRVVACVAGLAALASLAPLARAWL